MHQTGALLENPHRNSYLSSTLDSAILYGLIDSDAYESLAMEGCVKQAAHLAGMIALRIGKKLGELISVSNGIVEPGMGPPLRKEYAYLSRSLPTLYLSPTPEKIILSANWLLPIPSRIDRISMSTQEKVQLFIYGRILHETHRHHWTVA